VNDPNEPPDGIRLSKDERKNLLAEIEKMSSRAETPEQLLQRAQAALGSGQVQQARRIYEALLETAPHVSGINYLRVQLENHEKEKKLHANLQTTEEMLLRYIQQRKKPLAQLALDTLIEIVPQHPKLPDYKLWVKDLDQEVLLQGRINNILNSGRQALSSGNVAEARKHLEQLQKLDPVSPAVGELAAAVDSHQREREASVGIDRYKKEVEEAIAKRQVEAARQALAHLGALDVPKITLDFYQKRLGELQQKMRDEVETSAIGAEFEKLLQGRDWSAARDVARRYGERFPHDPRGAELFNRVNHLEASQRREQAKEQGIATLEQFIAQGRKHEAELALKLLRGMSIEPARLAALEEKVKVLG
jgi:tetratricopeptide (TPR) repeat protein